MEKLTLENIAPYLPYGLRIKRVERNLLMNTGKGSSVHWIGISAVIDWYNSDMSSKPIPVLRPMDLTKPIIVEGKEIIPIVELAKISLTQKFRYGKDWNLEDISFIKSETSTTVKFKEDHSYYRFSVDFNLSNERIGFYLVRDNDIAYYLNQLALFKKLYEWKFDINGLIEKGLAIDVNTLTTNPYN